MNVKQVIILHLVLVVGSVMAIVTAAACTSTQTQKVKDITVLALGERATVCKLIDQAVVRDTKYSKAQELCNAGAELQDIINSLAEKEKVCDEKE